MPTVNESRSPTLLWLTFGLLLGIVLSVSTFWAFLAFSTWSLTNSDRAVYNETHPEANIAGKVDADTASNLQSPTQIDQLIANLDSFNQFAILISYLAKADETTLLDLFEDSESIDSASRRKAARSAIVRRWASLNPQAAFAKVMTLSTHQQTPLLTDVFHEWSLLNLNQALESASTLDGRLKNQALQEILRTRDDLSDTDRHEIAERLGGVDYAMALLAEERALAAVLANPREAWNTLVRDGLQNQFRIDSFVHIAVEWVAQDGLEALQEIAESLTWDVDSYLHICDRVAEAVAQSNVVDTFNYVSTMDEDIRRKFLRPVGMTWARVDPAAALKAVDELENTALTDGVARAITQLWAKSSPREILPLLDNYSKQIQLVAMEGIAIKLIQTAPQEALLLIQEWGSAGLDMTSVIRSVIYEWSESDPTAALDWLLSQDSEDWTRYHDMLETTLRGLTSVDPIRAFEIAMKQPLPNPHSSGTEVWVILELSRSNLDKAIELLPQVRDSSKMIASKWVGNALVENGKPYQALNLAENIQEDRRDSFYFDLTVRWGGYNPLELFEALESLPTQQIQSNAAKGLIWNNRYESVLTNSQLEQARSYLTEDHLADVERWRDL